MVKWVDPIITRFRLWPRPHMFRAHDHTESSADGAGAGLLLAERVAAIVGSWPFLITQALFLVLWLVYNTLQITGHFDPPPYILLNLLLSFQAAFTGPVLLIAANVGAMRDHRQYDRIEHLTAKTEDVGEQTRALADRLVELERQLDEHVAQSLRSHTEELRELSALVRALHTAIVPTDPPTLDRLPVAALTPQGADTALDGTPETSDSPVVALPAFRRAASRASKRRS